MNPSNAASSSATPLVAKRKRGRPRKDASTTPQNNSRVSAPEQDVNLVGRAVSGVAEGPFEAGFVITVKVKDSDKILRGVVFARGKVVPVTPETDVAPNVKMIVREKINNRADEGQSCPPNDQAMKDAVEMSECAQTLILLPHGEDPEEVMDETDAATCLVEFVSTPETTMVPAQQNLALAQKEYQDSSCVVRGFDLNVEAPVHPEQLELGNKSGDKKGKAKVDC